VKPSGQGTGTAGFFFWDDGAIESGFSFHEFPFDPERLQVEIVEQRQIAMQQLPADADVEEMQSNAGNRSHWKLIAAVCFEVATESGTYRANGWVPTFRLQTR
jgi:hypothetical protein